MLKDHSRTAGSIASLTRSQSQPQYGLANLVSSSSAGTGQNQNAAARAQAEALAGDALFRQGDYRGAAVRFTEATRLQPNEGKYQILVAFSHWRSGYPEQGEPHFRTALALQPNNPGLHEMLAWLYVEQGRLDDAMKHAKTAVTLDAHTLSYQVTLADVLCAAGQVNAAWERLRPALESGNGGVWPARVFAKIAPYVGQAAKAVERIEKELAARDVSPVDSQRLHYAAANLLDGLGQYDSAFAHARRANKEFAQPFDPDSHSRYVLNRINYYTPQRLAALPRATHHNSRPVLIVGITRSGTSLVEQILASHQQVFGGGELSWLSQSATHALGSSWANGTPFPMLWDHLSVALANELASSYLDRITTLNNTATYVTDKMPENYLFLGTAQLLLPETRVIHCMRDPRDTCLSCYMTDFASGKQFSQKLPHLVQYYRDYQRLMAHWKKVLDLPILDVRYEDMVADQAGQTRRILEFLNLPWDDNCLKHHQNPRHVATASREQVRRPIYGSSVGRWKHYEKHIPELLELVKE